MSERIEWIEQQQLSKWLVHIIDREADSVDHLRRWSQHGHYWLVRAKANTKSTLRAKDISLATLAQQMTFRETRKVICKGQTCTQWIAGTQVVLARKAKPRRVDNNGHRVKAIAGKPLAVRLIVSQITNEDGDIVAQWYLLSNVPEHIEDEQLALWYYWRWEIESFFKLLKGAGHQLESWEQRQLALHSIAFLLQLRLVLWHGD